jgi:predicted NAD/FAD-binding protein
VNSENRVAVIGAGWAGLSAAVTLAERGLAVTLFEASRSLGGRARRVNIDGVDLDNGQHILIGAYSELFRLMRLVGVPDDAVLRLPLEIRYFDGFHFRARRLPCPLGLLGGLLLAKRVSFSDRLNAVRFMAAMQTARFALREDISVEILLQRHKQSGAIGHYLWRPLCVSALNTPAAEASAAAFLVVLRDALCGAREASDLLLPRVDLSRLFPEPAAEFVRLHRGDVRLRVSVQDVQKLRSEFKDIIVAVGPHQLKALLPEVTHEGKAAHAGVEALQGVGEQQRQLAAFVERFR